MREKLGLPRLSVLKIYVEKSDVMSAIINNNLYPSNSRPNLHCKPSVIVNSNIPVYNTKHVYTSTCSATEALFYNVYVQKTLYMNNAYLVNNSFYPFFVACRHHLFMSFPLESNSILNLTGQYGFSKHLYELNIAQIKGAKSIKVKYPKR